MTDQPNGRDNKGRFAKGNPGGPGRLPRPAEEAAFDRFRAFYSNGRLQEVIDALHRQATRGNAKAIELVLAYLIGKPTQPIDMASDSIVRVIISHERREHNDTGTS